MPKAGIWEINKKAFDSLKNSDEYDCSIYDLGTVYFGNDYFKLTGARKEDAVTIEYTHYMPLEKYNTVQFKEQDIQFNFLNLDEMSREFYIRSDSSQEYCKDININIFTKNNFEEAVCEMLYRDGKIFCNHYNEYVDIKERNSGFFQQLENQSNKVYKSLCKKEKLSYPELSALSNYYDKKLWNAYDKLDEQAIESGQNFILKEMVRDGLSDQRISIVGQKMESINEGFTPSWANDSIKDGEIKKIRAEINQTKNNIKTKQR